MSNNGIDTLLAQPASVPDEQEAEMYAVRYISHWDGEGDDVYVLAWKHNGELVTLEGGVKLSELLEYRGDKIVNVWPLRTSDHAAFATPTDQDA